ncbi:glycoside hydrolase family protein [Chitinasiproducens palmae]|uniref:Lysozyme n=1 Tax=Chitinasiproducens palmae TaxID=1770053 RepID=A0A1H2PSE0_9BURK|nr:glycoside hydrolase family protein [Chitinasiproducens palmae]SDV49062.1 lysozyme [Chitinasiproducens palmae]
MTSYDKATLQAELKRDEGVRLKPYKDSLGKLSIGVGRNLDDVGLSSDEVAFLLTNDIARTETALDRHLPWWRTLDAVRQRVVVNMAFNMGADAPGRGLLSFANTIAAIQRGDYSAAAMGMLDSKWASQVGSRAERLANLMRTGA